MASRYHPIYGTIWTDARLEGLEFETKAFFAFLCSNDRIRPSGIYRATDEQLAADTTLPVKRVRDYLRLLVERRRIVRDGAWVFVRGYLKRQPNHANMLKAAQLDVASCTSPVIITDFGQRYPLHNQWSADRLATIGKALNGNRPSDAVALDLQSNTERNLVPGSGPPTGEESDRLSAPADPSWGRPEDLVDLYNRLAPPGLPRVTRLTPGRRSKARAYLAQFPEREFWTGCFSELKFSRLLLGLEPSPGHGSFKGDFDWLLTKGKDGTENAVKTQEGRYRDKGVT